MVTFDTSALLSLFDSRQPLHRDVLEIATANQGALIVPMGIMSEISYFVESRLGHGVLNAFLQDIRDDVYAIYCGEPDIDRIAGLVARYGDLPLGYADAAVIACAERHGGRVATLDHRHFGVVAREGTIQIVP